MNWVSLRLHGKFDLSPQHVTLPWLPRAHVLFSPKANELISDGVAPIAGAPVPQQTSLPSLDTAQACRDPAAIVRYDPVGSWPTTPVSFPKHRISMEPRNNPQTKSRPTAMSENLTPSGKTSCFHRQQMGRPPAWMPQTRESPAERSARGGPR